MRKSEQVHSLCLMDNTHGTLKRHAENALAACSTVLRTMGLQRGYHYMQSRTQSLQAFWSAGQRREDSGDIQKIQFF